MSASGLVGSDIRSKRTQGSIFLEATREFRLKKADPLTTT